MARKLWPWFVGGTAAILGAGALVGARRGLGALVGPDSVSGFPLGLGLALQRAKNYAEFNTSFHFGEDEKTGWVLAMRGVPVSFGDDRSQTDREARNTLHALWLSRRRLLPKGALPGWDRYSKEVYQVPSWIMRTPDAPAAAVTAFPVDEFGRIKQGHYGGGQSLWDATFGGLLQNPLFRFVVTTAIVAGGGPAGIAAVGAYSMWQNRARELNLKNVVLSTARTYAVSKCGETCGMAFDFGVGVAGGRTVNDSAKDALVKHMSPEQRAYYDQGAAITAKAGLRV